MIINSLPVANISINSRVRKIRGVGNQGGGREVCLLHNSKLLKQAIPFVAYIINY